MCLCCQSCQHSEDLISGGTKKAAQLARLLFQGKSNSSVSADDHGNLGAGIGISYSRNSVATLISSNFFINADLPERKNIGDHWKEN